MKDFQSSLPLSTTFNSSQSLCHVPGTSPQNDLSVWYWEEGMQGPDPYTHMVAIPSSI